MHPFSMFVDIIAFRLRLGGPIRSFADCLKFVIITNLTSDVHGPQSDSVSNKPLPYAENEVHWGFNGLSFSINWKRTKGLGKVTKCMYSLKSKEILY